MTNTENFYARNGDEVRVGDTVLYQNPWLKSGGKPVGPIPHIVIQIRQFTNFAAFRLVSTEDNRRSNGLVEDILSRVNTDYRDMSPEYILALRGASNDR